MKDYIMEEINPFISEQKLSVVIMNKSKRFISIDAIPASDEIIDNPKVGEIKIPFLVDRAKSTKVYYTPELRIIYMRLSPIAHQLTRYFEGIIQWNEDIVKFNMNKFMKEADVKSRTTVYKGIQELCRYAFITPHRRQTYYWINPFRFFCGSRVSKYPKNISETRGRK